MSITNLNQFPLYKIPLNINTIYLTFLSVIFFQFLLLCKRIFTFLHLLCSQNQDSNSIKNRAFEFEQPTKERKEILSGDNMEIVLRSLGISEEGNLPAVDEDELVNVFEERNASLDEVKHAFDVFDCNRDGFIDEKEIQKVLCGLGFDEGLDLEKCRRMIGVFDENGDGRIDFDEFMKVMEISFS